MRVKTIHLHGAGSLIAAGLALALGAGFSSDAAAAGRHAVAVTRASGPAVVTAPSTTMTLAVGHGQLVHLPSPMSDLFVADDKTADVQVRSPTELYVFGKAAGETTVSATAKGGGVVFSANVRVGTNYDKLDQMLALAMPDAQVHVTPLNGMVLLTGTVGTPQDVEDMAQLVQGFVGKDTQVVSRVRTATPLQVNLRVRIVEMNRDFAKSVGVNLLSRDTSGGFLFGVGQGSPGTITTGETGGTTFNVANAAAATTLHFAGHLLGLDLLSTVDLAETDGLATVLAEPNLTALSGETASFLAGGEIPIPVPQFQGVTTIEYKQYGVSLSFTPIVLSDGRISMRVRPEVSQLTKSSVSINGYNIPGLTTRRAETTVELGSGQSFVIGGLLQNNTTNSVTKAPFLGDLPILGTLFRSNSWERQETELVIIVTPYLVRPVNPQQLASPLDGYRAPNDGQRILEGRSFYGKSGAVAPHPIAAAPVTASTGPGFTSN